MAIESVITGNLGADPDVRWTRGGQQVTELRICATPRRPRRGADGNPTGDWEDAGAPVWVRVGLWGERYSWVAETCRKGDTVSVAGTLALAEFTGRDGQRREALEVLNPRFLGTLAARRTYQQATQARPGGNPTGQAGGGNPWGRQPTDEAPF